jgi:hypothetical protein
VKTVCLASAVIAVSTEHGRVQRFENELAVLIAPR